VCDISIKVNNIIIIINGTTRKAQTSAKASLWEKALLACWFTYLFWGEHWTV